MGFMWHTFTCLILTLAAAQGVSPGYIVDVTKPEWYDNYTEDMWRYMNNNTSWISMTPRKVEDLGEVIGRDSQCTWITKVIKPYVIKDTNNIVKYPIVQTKTFEQLVEATSCQSDGVSCAQDFGLEHLNMTAQCKTRYRKMPFYIYDVELMKVRYYYAHIPFCCQCRLVSLK